MQRGISERRGLYELVLRVAREVLGERIVGVVVFGSTVYMGRGRDVDILVVVEGRVGLREKLELEHEIVRRLRRAAPWQEFDVHVFDLEGFRENLVPGGFLSGLALGYEVLVDRGGVVEGMILEFLERLARERYVLHNKYGSWDLSHYARVTLSLRKARAGSRPR